MRADRLLAIVMYLQVNKKMTAKELSRELQVAERTIYRDIVALSTAGIPVYATKGPKGGFSLIEEFKTTLTGLTEDELKTLFMLDLPPHLVQLGLDQKAKLALLKLSAALPGSGTPQINFLDRKFLIDPYPWYRRVTQHPILQAVHNALWYNQRLKIVYQFPFNVTREWVLEPHGLVAKEDGWYIVCRRIGESMRVLQISRFLEAHILDETFSRIQAFNLEMFWQEWRLDYERKHQSYPVCMFVKGGYTPDFLKDKQVIDIVDDSLKSKTGWKKLKVYFNNLHDARKTILGYGNAVEVIEPESLRLSIMDHAQQVLNQYKSKH